MVYIDGRMAEDMLGRRGQLENISEIVVVIGLLVLVWIFILVLSTLTELDISTAKERYFSLEGSSLLDNGLIKTDLINVLKIPLTEGTALADFFAYIPRNYQSQTDQFLTDWVVYYGNGKDSGSITTCNEKTLGLLKQYLDPVYGNMWSIYVTSSQDSIRPLFVCAGYKTIGPGAGEIPKDAKNVTIPSLDPLVDVTVMFKVGL